jgi:hypothetical protein
MWRMSDVTQLSIDENVSNLLLIFISLPIDVSCLIIKAWKNNFNYWKWNMFPENIGLMGRTRGWQKWCMGFCWKPPKWHLQLPPSYYNQRGQNYYNELTTPNDCISIYMWWNNGKGLWLCSSWKQWVYLSFSTTFLGQCWNVWLSLVD